MKLTSLKLPKGKKSSSIDKSVADSPSYPYGTELRLDDKALTKLKMKTPKVGRKVFVGAEGVVTSVSERDGAYGKDRDVCIQLTKLVIEQDKGTAVDAVNEALAS